MRISKETGWKGILLVLESELQEQYRFMIWVLECGQHTKVILGWAQLYIPKTSLLH